MTILQYFLRQGRKDVERAHSELLHAETKLAGQESESQGPAGAQRGNVHVGMKLTISRWYHLQVIST